MRLQTSGTLKAPIEVVFDCLTDIDFLKKEIRRTEGGKSYKVQHDRKNPFGVGKKVSFISDEPEFVMTITENNGRDRLVILFEPKPKYRELLGTLEYRAELKKNKNKTKYVFSYSSSKEPAGVFKLVALVVRFIFRLSFRGTKRRFTKFAESKCV